MNIRCCFRVLLVAFLTVGVSSVWARTIVWSGGTGGADTNGTSWNLPSNWSGGALPTAGDTAEFQTAGVTNNKVFSLDAPQSVISLNYYGGNVAFTVGTAADVGAGNTLTLARVGRGNSMASANSYLIPNVILSTNSVWDMAPAFNASFGVAVSGVISGAGKGVGKWNTGTLTLQGSNLYDGVTSVNAGNLTLDFNTSAGPAANIIAPTSVLEMNTGTLVLNGRNASAAKRSQTVNTLSINRGSTSLQIVNTKSDAYTRFTIGGISRNTGATLNLVQPTVNTTISADNGYTTSLGNDSTGILGAYLTVGGTNWAANNGVNIVAYTGYTDLPGSSPVMVDDATKNVRVTNSTTDVTLSGGTNTINTLLLKDSAARTIAVGTGQMLRVGPVGGILTPSGTGILNLGTPGAAGTLTAGGADNAAGEIIFLNATTITNHTVVADNGSGAVALTKTGSGLLVMVATNTYSGGTYMLGGTLLLPAGANCLSSNGPLMVVGGTLNLGGSSQTVTGAVLFADGTTTNGTITKVGANYDARGGTVAAVLAGNVGLVKTGHGSLTLKGANYYTGDTTIFEGGATLDGSTNVKANLIIGSIDGIFPASVSIANNTTPLTAARNITIYGNGSLNFGGAAQHVGGSITILGGAVTGGTQPYADAGMAVYMTGGSLAGTWYNADFNITSYATSITAYVSATLNLTHTFTVANGTAPIDLQFSGNFSGSGKRLTKAGPGVMAITSGIGHSASGFTVINGGTLLVNNTTGAGLGAAVVTNNAGCTLGGTGTIGGIANYSNANVVVTGASGNLATLAPGSVNATNEAHVIGTLTVGSATQTNNVTMKNYSRLLINFDSAGSYDRLVVNGTLDLSATLDTIDLALPVAGLNPGSYTVVTATNIIGTFNTVTNVPASYTLTQTSSNIVLSVPVRGTRFMVY